jgi:hypothetical protein
MHHDVAEEFFASLFGLSLSSLVTPKVIKRR